MMRHYLRIALRVPASPRLLTRGVLMRTAARALITHTRPAKRRPSRRSSAPVGAVHMAVIAIAADADLHPAAPTRILPVALLPHRTPHLTKQWTNPCSARITARRISPARHRTEGPGSDRQILARAFISICVAQKNSGHRQPSPRSDRAISAWTSQLQKKRGSLPVGDRVPEHLTGLILASNTGLILKSASGLFIAGVNGFSECMSFRA
jgi:hypothetical protein